MGTGMVRFAQSSHLRMWTSVPQIEAFFTRIRTSLIPISGTGTSSSQSPGSGLLFTSAFINRPTAIDSFVPLVILSPALWLPADMINAQEFPMRARFPTALVFSAISLGTLLQAAIDDPVKLDT